MNIEVDTELSAFDSETECSSVGSLRPMRRKILFTTNLPNVGDIDDALLRPGRCFGNVRTRALNRSEAAKLVTRVQGEQQEVIKRTMQRALPDGSVAVTLAELYRHLPTPIAKRREPHEEYRPVTGDPRSPLPSFGRTTY
jgi:hypothetical protein